VIVTLQQCPEDASKKNHTFKIIPGGLQEALEIEVEYKCDCNCETSEVREDNPWCSLVLR